MTRLPDFIIIGAQKAGSTFVQQAVQDHPQAWMPRGETPFFEGTHFASEKVGPFFTDLFAPAREDQLHGIKRPNYLGRAEVAARISGNLPDVKLLAVLREPVARAVSGYFHYMKTCLTPVLPLEVGFRKLLRGELKHSYPRSEDIIEFGFYARHLSRYFDSFPAHRLHVVLFDDLLTRPLEVARCVYRFLGLDVSVMPQRMDERPMAATYSLPRLRINAALRRLDTAVAPDRSLVRRRTGPLAAVARATRVTLDQFLLAPMLPQVKPTLSPDLRHELVELYRDDVSQLRKLLDNPLPGWPQ